jgi:hypothetical protein
MPPPRTRKSLRLHRCVSVHFGNVGASDERFLTRTGQYHHAYGIVLCSLGEGQGQLVERLTVERIEFVRAVDDDMAHRAAVADFQVAIGHGELSGR